MVLHDWQRGRIPFFVPPPVQEGEPSEEIPTNGGAETEDASVSGDRTSAAMKAIANIIHSQQEKHVPVQRELFGEDELDAENTQIKQMDNIDWGVTAPSVLLSFDYIVHWMVIQLNQSRGAFLSQSKS